MSPKRPLKKQSMQTQNRNEFVKNKKNKKKATQKHLTHPSYLISPITQKSEPPAFNHLLIIIYSLLVSLLLSSLLLCSRLFVLLNVWLHWYLEQFSRFIFSWLLSMYTIGACSYLKSQNQKNPHTHKNRNIFQLYHVYGGLIRGFNCAHSQLPSSQC